jgi:hypothetical protein
MTKTTGLNEIPVAEVRNPIPERYQIHDTIAGQRIYDYHLFDYIKEEDGTYFLAASEDKKGFIKLKEKLNSLRAAGRIQAAIDCLRRR